MNEQDYHIISVSSASHPVMFEITVSENTPDDDDDNKKVLKRRLGIEPRYRYCLDVMTNNKLGKATHGRSIIGGNVQSLIELFCSQYNWNTLSLQHKETREIELVLVAQRRDGEDEVSYNVETEVCISVGDPSHHLSISQILSARINQFPVEWEMLFPQDEDE